MKKRPSFPKAAYIALNSFPAPESDFPTFTIMPTDELFRFLQVGGLHVRSIPIHALSFTDAQRNTPKQNDLCEICGDVEVRIRRRALFYHAEPFGLLAMIAV